MVICEFPACSEQGYFDTTRAVRSRLAELLGSAAHDPCQQQEGQQHHSTQAVSEAKASILQFQVNRTALCCCLRALKIFEPRSVFAGGVLSATGQLFLVSGGKLMLSSELA